MSTMVHVRMDEDLKDRATVALEAMGLSVADAVRLLFHRIAADQAFPLELKAPNAETRAALDEAADLLRARTARFDDAEALIASLDG